ncbi:biotin-dependent carboxyltransferase family protein [Robbsia sp. Bb-Pol-6]|uniref:Biotin-dependent carboxyltransferase family protein n=1 Tax=Robbsia betulipollinis TaxID=2981849 RepID=A0ABT3ZH99_9BURK|nr:biotin-dependent carboxyltransferase family protein [Robbsia betulipollinis]MCY0385900.1 biotin-dependent carboxyltransferase family protein [Robbsia betulipollinis]
MIEILSNAGLATVQDQGRRGSLRFGVGHSGAMDRVALSIANIMLGNDENAAGIEIPVFPFRVRFDADSDFVLSGAPGTATLGDTPVLPMWLTHARAGQILTIRQPARGARRYLQLAGGIDVPLVLGSRSTQLRGAFGGLAGRALRRGDRLASAPLHPEQAGADAGKPRFGVMSPDMALPCGASGQDAAPGQPCVAGPGGQIVTLRVLPAAEYALYTDASLAGFWNADWLVTPQSNRYGYRLEGPGLVPTRAIEKRSHGIVPGVIQVPHSGQPIIQLSDAQPSGGYPKVGTVIEADLWRVAQAPIGATLRFVQTTFAEAVAAGEALAQYIAQVRLAVALHREYPQS